MNSERRDAEPRVMSSVGHEAGPRDPSLSFVISPRLVLRVGVPLALAFSVLSLLGQIMLHGMGMESGAVPFYADLTDVDFERSIPTWFQTITLVACAAALWTVANEVRRLGRPDHLRWRVLSAAFLFLSMDEMLALHERATEPVRDAFDLGGAFFLAWIAIAIPLVLVFGLAFVPFLRRLPRRTRAAFLASAVLYLGGAIGMEMVGGALFESSGVDTVAFSLATTAEELLEMLGMLLFLASVAHFRLHHLGTSRPRTDEASDRPPRATPQPTEAQTSAS